MVAKYVAECLGTFFLTLVVGCATLTTSAIWGATGCACALMVLIYAFGPVSGGHFNPAVSVACCIIERLSFGELLAYMLFQVLGAFLGTATYSFLFMKSFNIAPMPEFSWAQAMSVEVIYTMMLCFVVLNCALGQSKDFAPLAIGFVLLAGAHAGGAISGACFNPAVALAIDVGSAGLGFGWSLAYIGFEFVGAALAASLYRAIRPKEFGLEDALIVESNGEGVTASMLFSEFFGTFILMVTVGLNVLSASTAGAWSIGAALMSMVYSLGDISGAHFNPAVTLAIAVMEKCESDICEAKYLFKRNERKAILYMISQILGAILGAWVFAITYNWHTFSLGPEHRHSWITRCIVDIFFTFTLCLTVMSVACVKATKAQDDYFGLAIGFAITVGGFAVGALSGGTMNPAVTFGVYTTGLLCPTCMGGRGTLAYMFFELIGGVLAAVAFRLFRPEEFPQLAMKPTPDYFQEAGRSVFTPNQDWQPMPLPGSQQFGAYPTGNYGAVPYGGGPIPNANIYGAPVPSGAIHNRYGVGY